MQIIFQTTNKKPQLTLITIAITLLLVTQATAQNCTPLTFNTNYKRCQIVVDQCSNTSTNSLSQQQFSYYKFKSCKIRICPSGSADPDCTSSIEMALQQDSCYWSCCASKTFDTGTCDQNNIKIKQRDDNMNSILAVVLTSCALCLIFSVSCFIVKWLQCFKKKQPPPPEPQAPVWTRHIYTDRKCTICQQFGSVVETSCKHFFHMKCYKAALKTKMGDGNCPSCEKISKKFRLWCDQCHERYINVMAQNVQNSQQLQIYYNEAKVLHVDCQIGLQGVPKTDVRLTSSSSD